MKVFLDFDDTLFDTNFHPGTFRKHWHKLMAKGGWTEEQIEETKKQFSGVAFTKRQPYSYQAHVALLEQLEPHGKVAEVMVHLNVFMKDLKRYVFPDVVPFLEELRKEDVIIVTYGDETYQKAKITGSGIDRFAAEVIVVDSGKLQVIEKWIQAHGGETAGERFWFVDDKPQYFEEAPPRRYNIETVFMNRSGQDILVPSADHVVRDCKELLLLLQEDEGAKKVLR